MDFTGTVDAREAVLNSLVLTVATHVSVPCSFCSAVDVYVVSTPLASLGCQLSRVCVYHTCQQNDTYRLMLP